MAAPAAILALQVAAKAMVAQVLTATPMAFAAQATLGLVVKVIVMLPIVMRLVLVTAAVSALEPSANHLKTKCSGE